jgi:hypothetical protein
VKVSKLIEFSCVEVAKVYGSDYNKLITNKMIGSSMGK